MRKKLFLIPFSLILALLSCLTVFADSKKLYLRGNYDYDITSYNVDIEVKPNNTYCITEYLDVYFNTSKHGIFRDLPTVNNIAREDGSTGTTYATIKNIDCDENYEVSREGDDLRIKIGDEDTTITGSKSYTISYDYALGNDILADADEFYFNVIGTGWNDTTISNVTFSIQMPDKFDENNLGMSYGKYGSSEYSGLFYYLDEETNTIYGELDSSIILGPNEGVNVRLTLPEGYFEKIDETPLLAYISIGIGIFAILLAFIMWLKFGKDDPVVETIEFNAPDGLNSMELSYCYKGRFDRNDVVSLIVYLAQKGYIRIEEGKGKDFKLIRLKYYDGSNNIERIFMKGLFENGDTATKSSLTNSFYKTVEAIRLQLTDKKNKEKIFVKSSLNKSWICYILSFITVFLAGIKPSLDYVYGTFEAVFFTAIASGIILTVFALLFNIRNLFSKKIPGIAAIIIGIAITIVGGSLGAIFLEGMFVISDTMYLIAFLFSVAVTIVSMFFSAIMRKRTEYGTQILGRILGFKRFLETAEKDRLEAMVKDDPQYFYNVLPYTYVLDISDKWIKKFEGITVEPPTWYTSPYEPMFSIYAFNSFMSHTMKSASSSMNSQPSSSSGSGGGFSGGGSGGGGGGSW